MKKLLCFLFFISSIIQSSLVEASTHDFEINEIPRIEALLKESTHFYSKLKKNSFNYEKTLNEDPLNSLLSKDLIFLKKRLIKSGLAPFSVEGTRLLIQSKDFSNIETQIVVDFKYYYQSTLIIQGIPYEFDPTLDLESLHNKYFKPLWKKYADENKRTSYLPLEIFSTIFALQGCTPQDQEKSANTVALVNAYARLCSDCVSLLTAPTGLAINAGLTLAEYTAKYALSKCSPGKCPPCRNEMCMKLPVIGPLKDIVRLHGERKALNHRNESSK